MFLSIDINRLDRHITILEREQKEVRAILELLQRQFDVATADILIGGSSLREILECLRNEEEYIDQRIKLLENAASSFENSNKSNSRTIDEIYQKLNGLDI